MTKHILFITIVLGLVGCSNSTIPLPPKAKEFKTACPVEILHLGGTCYSVANSHNETVAWYEDKAKKEKWTFNVTTDDEPFSFVLITHDKKATLTFYRQNDEKHTGILISDSN